MRAPLLIVDDDETLREHPDGMAVVLDFNMPGMDGRQLLEAMAQHEDLARQHGLILATATYNRTFPPRLRPPADAPQCAGARQAV